MKAIGITIAKAPVFSLLLLLTLVAFAQPLQAAVPGCENTQIRLTPDYRYFIGSAEYQSAEGNPEWGSSYRWLADGTVIEEGTVGEGLLLHLDAGMGGANGESPVESNSVAYVPGRWGSALALPENGRLQYSTPGNLDWEEGTIEMWVALRQDGTNAVYSSRDHLLFQYLSPKGDFMQIGQSASGRVIHVGGMVSNEWESAYGIAGSMVNWKAGEWHHIAFTFSVKDNSMKMYIDGAFSAANNEGHYYAPEGSGATFSIGSGINSPAAEYYIDEVRISGRAATADEIVERARRVEANSANEVWLASSNVTLGAELVFELTAASGTNHGVPCQSAPVQANGIPVYNAGPPSTLLKAGSTNFNLRVESAMETECRYSVGSALPYDQMTPFGQTGGTAHESIISGINPDPNQINDVYVRCGAAPDYLMHLQYRVLSQVNPSYPRKGNLWGWTQWIGTGLSNMAKVDLWLGVAAKADEIITLRQLNPNIRVLTSINAVEGSGVPEEYYLKDLNGNKIEVWPGSYRLNLTKPEVAEYQARHAYETVLKTGLMADGVFFDNFMTRQAWLTNDIYGNPVQLDADEDGVADDLNELDRKWRDGVFLEMALFRKLMPDAIVTGHSMDIDEPGIAESFNGISVGFAMAHVLEGKQTFDSVLARYNQWMSEVVDPQVTMIESSPMEQIAYGYGYANTQRQSLMNGISDSTLEFARTFYPYMRFGLGFTLMNDGYFTHEFGDIWHGNQWWYDELDYNLGQPLGAARAVQLPDAANTNRISNGGFEAVSDEWALVAGPGCAATFAQDENGVSGSAARIDISATTGTDWHIEFAQANRSVEQGVEYDLTLWVKSDAPRAFTVNGQKGTPDWTYYGLGGRIQSSTNWEQKTITFQANATVSDFKLQFLLGEETGTIWFDDIEIRKHPPTVLRRDFSNGTVLLNASKDPVSVAVGSGYKRLKGSQAPKHQLILDDQHAGFSTTGAWSLQQYDSGLWKAAGPYYHAWEGSLHESSGGSATASWKLPIEDDDEYVLSAWWPAAPDAGTWSTNVLYEILSGGVVIVRTNFNQRVDGDQWHDLPPVRLNSTNDCYVRVSSQAGVFVADAIQLKSAARYNDGEPVSEVKLQGMDAIILAVDANAKVEPPALSGITIRDGHLVFSVVNLVPGKSYSLQRRNTLAGVGWESIESFEATGSSMQVLDALPSGQSQYFYRIQVLQ